MMQFFAFVIAFTCLWPKGQSSFSNIVQVVVVTQEDRLKNNSLSGYVTLENVTDRHNYNITVLKDGWKSYQEILKRFCSIVKNRGVTAIIFKDRSSNFKIFDVFASFMGVPVIKLFHSNYEPQVFKQKQGTILHLDPDPSSPLVVIIEVLKKYKRNDRVAVISDERQLNIASKLLERLREASSSNLDVFLTFTITEKYETKYHKILSILSALNTRAVVLLLEHNFTTDLLHAAENFGFSDSDCIWILGNSLDENKRIPLLGKTLGIQLSRVHFNHGKLPAWKNALMNDAIKVLEKAFQTTSSTDSKVFSLLKDCNPTKRGLLEKSFHRAMRNVQFQGKTGWVQFNNQGYRANVEHDIVYWYKNETNNKMLLAEYHNNKLTVHYTGWPPAEQISDKLELKIAKKIPLKVSVFLQEPYVTINKNSGGNNSDETCALGWSCVGVDGTYSCCTGYCIDLLKLLMRELGFSVIIQVVKDGKYGALNHTTGKWSGLIGEVIGGEADIALADLTINEQRSKVVDFTHPFLDAGMGVLVKVARRDKNSWTGFMDPFATTLWIALIICINTAVLIMWLLERYSPFGQLERGKLLHKNKEYRFDLIQTIWFTWSLVFQTFDVGCKPKSFSCRIVALFFAFGMLIVITSYTANLAAFLVVEEEILPLSDAGIRDHKLQDPPSGFRMGTIADSSFERFFQATDDPMLSRIWQHMKHNSVKGFAEAIKQMNSGKLQAFVSDYPTLENFAAKSRDCSFKIVGNSFFQSGFGLAIGKNSSLTLKISQVLMNYEDYDISRTLRRRWFLGQCNTVNSDENALFARLSIADLSGLFLAICLGVGISVLFFTLECLKITFKNSSSYIFGKK